MTFVMHSGLARPSLWFSETFDYFGASRSLMSLFFCRMTLSQTRTWHSDLEVPVDSLKYKLEALWRVKMKVVSLVTGT